MAAFSYQYQPFLVDSSCFSDINTSLPPLHFQIHHHQENSCVDQSSKISISDADFSVVKNQSPTPESSMVVDNIENGEQVTQKVKVSPPMDKKRRSRNGSSLSSPLSKKRSDGEEEPSKGYIHVRARRGQATDSHSLAERVRREKISEKMKILQQLVPGCDRVTGKALVLEEIINYVQSLQNQVELLSMKLASVNPIFFDMAMDLDTLLLRPDQNIQKSNSMEPPSPPIVPPLCSNHATAFDDTTTLTTTNSSFPAANNDYLLDYSSSVFLQGQRSNNNFLEHTGGPFWDTEDQRQMFLNPYGLGNNTRSIN